MPKLVLESRLLWISRGHCIQAFRRGSEHCLDKGPEVVLDGRREDVCHFVKNGNTIISGESNGALVGWSEITRKKIFVKQNCHTSDIDAIDYTENLIVTGSRDESVKEAISKPSYDPELTKNIISEMIEQQTCASNIIIYNCGRSKRTPGRLRKAAEIISDLDPSILTFNI
ncbi:hypothetical protein J437_LFUL017398 [Ladona fulva]|uniref:Uncharacterized protein n=1 Tax=Ladona fulva TaxID=123851 RepID=A0A8K0KNN1_LADFU|nr:hypothetical protein J437_LFUL017398 [Ladona fulva]